MTFLHSLPSVLFVDLGGPEALPYVFTQRHSELGTKTVLLPLVCSSFCSRPPGFCPRPADDVIPRPFRKPGTIPAQVRAIIPKAITGAGAKAHTSVCGASEPQESPCIGARFALRALRVHLPGFGRSGCHHRHQCESNMKHIRADNARKSRGVPSAGRVCPSIPSSRLRIGMYTILMISSPNIVWACGLSTARVPHHFDQQTAAGCRLARYAAHSFLDLTTELSTIMPKSTAPRLKRLAAMPNRTSPANANSHR